MSIGNVSRLKLEHDLPFELEARRSFSTTCPKCIQHRSNKSAKSLSVYRDDDGMVRYRCNHTDQCEWNTWQTRPDPNPTSVSREENEPALMPIPESVDIQDNYLGDKLYWYRNVEGAYLFANRRIQVNESTKIYVPFVYTSQGFITGKAAKWPKDFKGLYGAQSIKGKTKVIIVEGEKAADAAQLLYPDYAVVSWKGGANNTDSADWSLLKDMEAALLWPDNDEPGKKVMRQIAHKLPCLKILIANVDHLPLGADLADDISAEDRLRAIKNATGISTKVAGVMSLEDINTQITTMTPSRSSGFEIMDAHTKLPGSGLLVIEGRTKHGKSALAVALTSAMLHKGLESTVLYYSYEMTASKVYLRYIKALKDNLDISNYQGTEESRIVGDLITGGRLQIVDQSSQLSIADIVVAASKPQIRGGIIVIDYLQIVPMNSGYGVASRQQKIKDMLDELRVVAHKNNVLVMVLSQLTPDYLNPKNDAPREAKDIHYSADMVLRVWNKAVDDSHPTYNNVQGDYIIHTYLNRDGESNVRFEASLLGGSKLTVKRRIKDK